MRQQTNYILIGSFVIGATVLAVAGAVMLGAGALSTRSVMLETYLEESVQGLDVGAHVRFRGIRVGQVEDITLTSQEYDSEEPLVLVRFSVQPFRGSSIERLNRLLTERLNEGLRARLASQGLTGALYLEADLYPNADTEHPPLKISWVPKHRYVPSIPSTISQLSDSVARILRDLESTDVAGLVAQIRNTLSSIEGAVNSAELPKLSARLMSVADSATAAFDQITSSVDSLGSSAKETLDAANQRIESVDPAALQQIVANLRGVAADLEPTRRALHKAIVAAGRAVGDARSAVQGRTRELDAILANVRRVSASVANLADTIEQYPSLLLFGNPPERADR